MEIVLLVVRGGHVMASVVLLLLLLFLLVLVLAPLGTSVRVVQAYLLQSLVAAGRLPLVGLLKRRQSLLLGALRRRDKILD